MPTPLPSPATSPQAALTETPATTTLLTVWHSWDSEQETVVRKLLDEYQRNHPGVIVRLHQVPVGQIISSYEEAVRGGEGPDILAGRAHWIGELAGNQTITSLGTLLDDGYWSKFYPFALEGIESSMHRFAVPYSCETVGLYYNRDFVTNPPTTTGSLLTLASTWPAPEQAGLILHLTFHNTAGYLYAFGGHLLDSEGRPALNTPEVTAWLNWLQGLREAPGVIVTDNYGQADSMFKSGSAAMVINGSWALHDYVQALGSDRLGVAPLPLLDETQAQPTPFVSYQVLMLNPARLQEHLPATLELLRFLGGPVVQAALADNLDLIPTWQELDLTRVPALAAFVEQAQMGRPRPIDESMDALWTPMDQLLYNVCSRHSPLDQALLETQSQVEQLLGEGGQ